jgi:hypothetical protein
VDALTVEPAAETTGSAAGSIALSASATGEHRGRVAGQGAVVITLRSAIVGRVGNAGSGGGLIVVESEASGEFFDAVGHDNDYMMMAA